MGNGVQVVTLWVFEYNLFVDGYMRKRLTCRLREEYYVYWIGFFCFVYWTIRQGESSVFWIMDAMCVETRKK